MRSPALDFLWREMRPYIYYLHSTNILLFRATHVMLIQKPAPIIQSTHWRYNMRQDTSLSCGKSECGRCRTFVLLAPWIGTSWLLYLDYSRLNHVPCVCCPLVVPCCPAFNWSVNLFTFIVCTNCLCIVCSYKYIYINIYIFMSEINIFT